MKYWSSTIISGARNKISSLSIRYHQFQKYMRANFSQNRNGVNHMGSGKVLFIDHFLKDQKIDFEYCGHQLGNLGDAAT